MNLIYKKAVHWMRIETERLVIRNFKEKDAAGLWDYLSQPRANCFLNEKLNTFEDAIADATIRSKDESQFAVCLKDDTVIGNLFTVKDEPDTYSVGWQFNEKYEGKGYASESARAFLNFLFKDKNARRIYAYVEDDNIRSQKLCERLGMRREAYFIEFISFIQSLDGTPKYENTYEYAILKREWTEK